MAIPEPLLSMCRDTVTVAPFVSVDAWGNNVHSTSTTTYTARIVGTRKIVRNANRDEVVSSAQVIMAADVTIDMRSKITLSTVPGGCSASPQILDVKYYPDDVADGMSHTVIYV